VTVNDGNKTDIIIVLRRFYGEMEMSLKREKIGTPVELETKKKLLIS
jgi:hypothetical protein